MTDKKLKLKQALFKITNPNIKKLDYKQALFLLHTIFSKIIKILETFCKNPNRYRDKKLNFYYINLVSLMDKILEVEGFTHFGFASPALMPTLIGDIDNAQKWWVANSGKLYDYYGLIDKEFILSGSKKFPIPKNLKELFQILNKLLKKHINKSVITILDDKKYQEHFGSKDNISSYFGFELENKTFRLKRIDNTDAVVDFEPKKGETLNTYYLMRAYVSGIKRKYTKKAGWIKTAITRKDIYGYIQKHWLRIDTSGDWLKNTKGNLIKKIPEKYKHNLIRIGYFNSRLQTYPFALKLPI